MAYKLRINSSVQEWKAYEMIMSFQKYFPKVYCYIFSLICMNIREGNWLISTYGMVSLQVQPKVRGGQPLVSFNNSRTFETNSSKRAVFFAVKNAKMVPNIRRTRSGTNNSCTLVDRSFSRCFPHWCGFYKVIPYEIEESHHNIIYLKNKIKKYNFGNACTRCTCTCTLRCV